tara:strand:+ start:65 stop:769 length:705 start_codon:yes stop_codon:yes gene_type:complete
MFLKNQLQWLFERKLIFLFLIEKKFLNPLISKDNKSLHKYKVFNDQCLLDVINKYFPKFQKLLPTGMYFPAPICRLIKKGEVFSPELAKKFHYDYIKIDYNQKWSFKKKEITGKVLKLFKSNIFFEKEINLYFVEYRSDNRWDKCYLECESTPMLALNFFYYKKKLMTTLNNQQTDTIDPKSFRVDKKERCFATSENFGEVLLADAPRFWLFDHLDESGTKIIFKDKSFKLTFS